MEVWATFLDVTTYAFTAHGFRSAFSDWASEISPYSGELRETALAHTISNSAERAYRRGDALEKRRTMMEAWATFCEPKTVPDFASLAERAVDEQETSE
jgi:integrase